MDIYQQLAIDIYSAQTDEYLNHMVYSGLSRKPESDTKLEYFIKLVEALLLNKSYVHVFKPAPGNKDIRANFDGVVINRNEFSHAWEPYLIVVKKEQYSPELADKILNGTDIQLSKFDTQILKRPKPSPDVQSQISIHVEFGEEVKEGDVLATIGYLKINSLVDFYKKRFDMVYEFCSEQINLFRKQAIEEERQKIRNYDKNIEQEQLKRKRQEEKEKRKNDTLYDVWNTKLDPEHNIYFRLIEELAKDGGDFILEQIDKSHFRLKGNKETLFQGYYAGLFYECADNNLIANKSDVVNITRALQIMINTADLKMDRKGFEVTIFGDNDKARLHRRQVKAALKKILNQDSEQHNSNKPKIRNLFEK